MIAGGAITAAYVAAWEAKRKKENPDHVWNIMVWCLILGILGARLYHVLSSPAGTNRGFDYYFIEHPWTTLPFPSALLIWEGGIGIFGGLVGGLLAILIYTHRHRLSPASVAVRLADLEKRGLLTVGEDRGPFYRYQPRKPDIAPTVSNLADRGSPSPPGEYDFRHLRADLLCCSRSESQCA